MRRVFRNALLILGFLIVGAFALFDWGEALSVAIGGAVAVLNFRWMTAAVDGLLRTGAKAPGTAEAVKYVLRLLLILATLFAMIHFPFLSLLGGAAGLSIFVLSGLLEAVLLLIEEFSSDR